MAVWNRGLGEGVIRHCDHGFLAPPSTAQYTSPLLGEHCQTVGMRCSMGWVGEFADNTMADSSFTTLECKLLARQPFRTHGRQAPHASRTWQVFAHRQRRRTALDYLSPDAYERR